MTNEEILQKALDKAKVNGYVDKYSHTPKQWLVFNRYFALIFRHKFAKAFWGEVEICSEDTGRWHKAPNCFCEYPDLRPAWQHHLREMALEEDSIKYLEQFI